MRYSHYFISSSHYYSNTYMRYSYIIEKAITTTSTPEPMKLAKTFTIDLSGTTCEIDAMIGYASYIIMDVRPSDGFPFEFTADDMETFEQYVEERITSTTLKALDLDTYQMRDFTVHVYGSDILAIVHESGHTVERNSATWSEVVESWFIDREYEMAVESDQPHLAAVAGFLRPIPLPTQQGVGNQYRRAA